MRSEIDVRQVMRRIIRTSDLTHYPYVTFDADYDAECDAVYDADYAADGDARSSLRITQTIAIIPQAFMFAFLLLYFLVLPRMTTAKPDLRVTLLAMPPRSALSGVSACSWYCYTACTRVAAV